MLGPQVGLCTLNAGREAVPPSRYNDVCRHYDGKSGRGPNFCALAAERYFSPPLQNHLPTPLQYHAKKFVNLLLSVSM